MCNCAFFVVLSDEMLQKEAGRQNNWANFVLRTPGVMEEKNGTYVIRFVIPVVFIIKLDWSVCACLTQLYDGRDMYTIYYIRNNYMFRHFFFHFST